MELINVKIGNAIHKIVKVEEKYQVISSFEGDFNNETFEFNNLIDAKNLLDNEINEHLNLMANLSKALFLALELSEKLNLDISEKLHEIIDNLDN